MLKVNNFLAKSPALIALICFSAAITLLITWEKDAIHWLAFTCSLPLLIATIFIAIRIKKVPLLIAFFCFSLLLIQNRLKPRQNHYSKFMQYASENVYVKGEVKDQFCNSAKLPWIPLRRSLTVEIDKIRFSKNEPWQECSGKSLMLVNPEASWQYGQAFEVNASLLAPQKEIISTQFSFSSWMQSQQITHVLEIHSIIKTSSPKKSFSSLLQETRNQLVAHATHRLTSDQHKKLLAAIVFGYKKALTHAEKQQYLISGSLHLFAVSGLHTAFVAAIILFFLTLCQLPRTWRFYLLPIFCGLYVMMVGMPTSAIRAWVFISLWSMSHAFKKPLIFINLWSIAALIILLVSPREIIAPGFQYSFMIVLFLNLYLKKSVRLYRYLKERQYWKHRQKNYPFKESIKKFIWASAISCSIAFTAALPLTLFYNGFISPAGLFCNFIIIPLLPIIFSLTIPSALGIPGASYALTATLNFIDAISTHGQIFWPQWQIAAVPSYWPLVFFLALIYFIIGKQHIYWRAIPLLITIIFLLPVTKEDKIFLLTSPGKNQCSALILHNNQAYLINCPDKYGQKTLVNIAKNEGILTIESLLILNKHSHWKKRTKLLQESLQIGKILTTSKSTKEQKNLLRENETKNGLLYRDRKITINRDITLEIVRKNHLGLEITYNFSNQKAQTIHWPVADQPRVLILQKNTRNSNLAAAFSP